MSKQVPDKAYFVEMVYTHMGIIYKIWLFLAALSAIILMTNLNLYVDNDHGS